MLGRAASNLRGIRVPGAARRGPPGCLTFIIYRSDQGHYPGLKDGPSPAIFKSIAMYQHILLPIDGSELSQVGLTQGLALARALKARVTIMTALEPVHIPSTEGVRLPGVQQQLQRQARERAQGWLDAAAAKARDAGVACTTHMQDGNQPYAAIVECAEQIGCDLIAMCSHGRSGMAAMVLGSQTQKVLAKSQIPVLVYR